MELNAELDRLKKYNIVDIEMNKQVKKWGVQNHNPHVFNTILVEEVGEVAKAILKTEGEGNTMSWQDVQEELIQVAAVAMSMIESIERNQVGIGTIN